VRLKCLCLTEILLTQKQAAGRKLACGRATDSGARFCYNSRNTLGGGKHFRPDLSENTREEKHESPVMAHAWC
jgi:hypothetical protein